MTLSRSVLTLSLLLVVGASGCTDDAEREAISPPILYPQELLGRYLLRVGPHVEQTRDDARWCYLEIAAEEGAPHRLTAKVWRPDDQTIACASVSYSRGGLSLEIRREYHTEKADVKETWRLTGLLKTPAAAKPTQRSSDQEHDEDEHEEAEEAAVAAAAEDTGSFLAGDATVVTVVYLPEQEETRNKTRRLKFKADRNASDVEEAREQLELAREAREEEERAEAQRLTEAQAELKAKAAAGESP